MASRPWSKFFWNDWRGDPRIRACSLAAQGLWMQMLCIAADADPIGYVTVGGRPMGATDLARQTGASEAEVRTLLDELDRNGVFSRDRKGCIYNRRMVRDTRILLRNQRNGKKGGNPKLLQPPDLTGGTGLGITERITPKPEARSQTSLCSESDEDKSSFRLNGKLTDRELDREFDDFWPIYPRRVGKQGALAEYRLVRRRGTPAVEIREGARRYAERRRGEDEQFTAHPKTWLHNGRWADETPSQMNVTMPDRPEGPPPPLSEREIEYLRTGILQ